MSCLPCRRAKVAERLDPRESENCTQMDENRMIQKYLASLLAWPLMAGLVLVACGSGSPESEPVCPPL